MTSWTGAHNISATDIAAALSQPMPTADQQKVIQAPASPALVVAGAGSGKTETMAARVVWLVANGHVNRDEILGLTFTRKAAGELAERIAVRLAVIDEYARRGLLPHLTQIVASGVLDRVDAAATGPQRALILTTVLDELAISYDTGWNPAQLRPAEDVMIRPRVSTYNAFADSLVREHAARIGRDPEAAMLSQAASWLLARDVVLKADMPELELMERSTATIIDAVQKLAGDALDHRANLDDAARITADYAQAFERAAERAGKCPAIVESARANLNDLPVLTQLVADYVAEKTRRGTLDFADQVGGAFDIVEGAPDVRDQLRQQYRVVLLDEYQDTSVIQTRFLAALFYDTAVMAVGDPHQSIYGWRGASADNLYAFAGSFARETPVSKFNLMTSWRNDQTILDVANRVLVPLARPTLEVSALEARPGAAAGEVGVRYALTVEDEAAEVADWFVERQAAHARKHNTPAPMSGAILFRSKRHMQTFAAALGHRGIAHRILGLGGLLSTPEVVDVVSLLRVLHDPGAGSSLIRLLVGPRFGVGVADMAALYDLAVTLAQRDGSLTPLPDEVRARLRQSRGADEAVSIVDAVDFIRTANDEYRLLAEITAEGRSRLRSAGDMLERLRRAAGQPLPDLIRLIELELRLDIELATNETKGPARSAATQLRAFSDEVRAFLTADDRGTIGSLLAWLDKAERSDELMPRPEPPEAGVVQLLTIHGSKGLEWDAVAVVRLVKDELPASVKDTSGWFAFGALPFALRGDSAALPRFSWDPDAEMAAAGDDPQKQNLAALDALAAGVTKAYPHGGALYKFKNEYKNYQQEEERRLAYVAVTRARGNLLLTGSHWAGQKKPRDPSVFLLEAIETLELSPIEPVDPDENPYVGTARTQTWPLDPLGGRRRIVEAAAQAVRTAASVAGTGSAAASNAAAGNAAASSAAASNAAAGNAGASIAGASNHGASARPVPTRELERLLAERAARKRGSRVDAPTRVPASRFKDYVLDFEGTARAIARPMPERPYVQTRQGTLFHAWVEHRSGLVGVGSSPDDSLWEQDEEAPGIDNVSAADSEVLARLQATFEKSEWASLQPIAVEIEINFVLGAETAVPQVGPGPNDATRTTESAPTPESAPPTGSAPTPDSAHIVICKLDAVYRRADRGGRIEIVDWKTGKAPRTAAQRDERMLQLALYRLAYHRHTQVPLEDIDVVLYYVADDMIIRGDRVYSEEELLQRWSAARAAR